MQCSYAAAYASRLDLSPVSLKPKAAIERRRERTYVHSQYCMAGSHRVDHYMQIELANVTGPYLPLAYPFPCPSIHGMHMHMRVCVCVLIAILFF